MSFKQDLEFSQVIELEFEQYILNKYKCFTENAQDKGLFPDWDISITGNTTNTGRISTFEIKYNRNYSQQTIVIEEIAFNNSNADYYILRVEDDSNWYMIRKSKLNDLIYTKCDFRKTVCTYGENKIIFIFDKELFLNKCKIV